MRICLRKPLFTIAGMAGLLIFSIATASTARIFTSIPGSVSINLISIQEMTDIDGSGTVDGLDLPTVADAVGTQPRGSPPEMSTGMEG